MRFREDDWRNAGAAAGTLRLDTTTAFYEQAANVALGYVRCHRGRCGGGAPPVPVIFGDLEGKTLGEWITEAVKTAVRQHPRHEPVTIGVPAPAAPPGAIPFKAPAVTR
jgi:hypothetical protein